MKSTGSTCECGDSSKNGLVYSDKLKYGNLRHLASIFQSESDRSNRWPQGSKPFVPLIKTTFPRLLVWKLNNHYYHHWKLRGRLKIQVIQSRAV